MANRKRAEVRSAVHRRIRRKVRGSTERPRLAVYRSLNHIYAQVIDDEKSQTLASASTTEKDLRGSSGGNVAAAKRVGQAIAERALSAGIDQVVFDRGGYLYHGRVRALTDAARAAGLNKGETLAREAEAAEKAAAEKASADEASAQAASAKEKSAKAKKGKSSKGESAGGAKAEAGSEVKTKEPKAGGAKAEAGSEGKAAKEPKAGGAKAEAGSVVKTKEPKAGGAKAEAGSVVKEEAKEAKEE